MTPAETIKRLEAVRNWHISEERYYAEKNTGITATHTMFIADIESALAALRGLASSASAIETTRCTCTDTTQCEYCRVLDEKNTRMLSAGTVAVPREPTDAMWDAAWKSIGLPYRAKLSMHEIRTLFEKFHAAMLSAAPAAPEAGSEQVAVTEVAASQGGGEGGNAGHGIGGFGPSPESQNGDTNG